MKLTIEEIITSGLFTNVFQPVYNVVSNTIVGYESLLRCEFASSPELLFNYAAEQGMIYELDVASIRNTVLTYSQHCLQDQRAVAKISINVYPSTMLHPFFLGFLDQLLEEAAYPMERIVLEINEAENFPDVKKLQQAVKKIKERNIMIAVDDLGKGNASIKTVIEIEPDIVKLDRYFSQDLTTNTMKQKFIKTASEFFGDSFVILEGIETLADLTTAKNMGIKHVQGYYLGRPEPLRNTLIKGEIAAKF